MISDIFCILLGLDKMKKNFCKHNTENRIENLYADDILQKINGILKC